MRPRKGLQFRLLSHTEAAVVRDREAARRNMSRMPPSEYTRILLDAKEGIIKPGDADRKISRNGGRVSVTPLPRPPEQ